MHHVIAIVCIIVCHRVTTLIVCHRAPLPLAFLHLASLVFYILHHACL
jgi:hypothetical protein